MKIPEIYRVIYDYSMNQNIFTLCEENNEVPKYITCFKKHSCQNVNWEAIKKWVSENPKKAEKIYNDFKRSR